MFSQFTWDVAFFFIGGHQKIKTEFVQFASLTNSSTIKNIVSDDENKQKNLINKMHKNCRMLVMFVMMGFRCSLTLISFENGFFAFVCLAFG